MKATHNDIRKEINAELKKHNLIMRKHKFTLNGQAAYYFEGRENGRVYMENMTFSSAWGSSMELDNPSRPFKL